MGLLLSENNCEFEGYGAKFILDTNEKKIYVNSYKSIDINTDPWGTLLDCS